MPTAQKDVSEFTQYRRLTTGSEGFTRHWTGLIYTDGIRILADCAGAHWLIDLIASYQSKLRKEPFQVWELTRDECEGTWRATCWSDTPRESTHLCHQDIEYSDFPDELLPLRLWVSNGTLLVPDEY